MTNYLFVLLIHRLGKFFLEQHDYFFDVLARDHFHSKFQCLFAYIKVRAGEHAKNLHGKVIQNAFILLPQLVDLFQDNQLNVVVRLFNAKLDEFGGRSLYSNGVVREGGKRGSSFVDNGRGVGLEEIENKAEVPSLSKN